MGTMWTSRWLRALVPLLLLVSSLGGSASAETISDLVVRVSQDRIESHVASLEGERATSEQMAAAAGYIAAQLEAYGYTVQSDPIDDSENLIAELAGTTNPSSIFVVGAHFDTVPGSPGADDDASGVAGMLEAARVLSAGRYESSIHFVAFALEESGLDGSRQLAAAYQSAGKDVIGMISLEMIGYTCEAPCQLPFSDIDRCLDVGIPGIRAGNYIAAVANTSSSDMLSDFLAAAASYAPGLPTNTAEVGGRGFCFPDTRRSDHASFWDEGYPAMLLTDTANFRNPNYHKATDTFETLDFGFATQVTRLVVGQAATRAVYVPEPGAVPLQLTVALLVAGLRRCPGTARRV